MATQLSQAQAAVRQTGHVYAMTNPRPTPHSVRPRQRCDRCDVVDAQNVQLLGVLDELSVFSPLCAYTTAGADPASSNSTRCTRCEMLDAQNGQLKEALNELNTLRAEIELLRHCNRTMKQQLERRQLLFMHEQVKELSELSVLVTSINQFAADM
ncbi:hypothetical protein PUNSTDRAFT_139364 [Punctularia strigosozonata HHB-11173 SS5]|uniref:Uncharacterized protein n=1 Tax=Punctularia strigosozonata (strain HHB-11173) TaxID=741275 RepID=R7S080_PUNST|nr:uncharacterized protein PUNSTDRAFT_139364 [Punctularia strigosozonata HHB-11173 SS5]EIN03648.1 hypothetical protein PUNSTDRAFT_139364 [Punctularia strigosozonata HHB-11173 SS5]